MADSIGTPPLTLRSAILSMNPKIALAFFLTTVAAALVIFLITMLVGNKLDAGTTALIASMVMLFIKMAADACGYQTQSSAGSDKKDDTQASVSKALAEKVPPAAPASVAPMAWWNRLVNGEPAAITAAAATDPKVMAFVTAANVGKATPEDLVYLVSKGLLTPERAAVIGGP